MVWKGKFIGALIGFLVTRSVWGAVMGAIVGHMFDESAGLRYANSAYAAAAAQAAGGGAPYASVSDVFFRTTFELMGHVAKSDGHVSEAEIDAARRLMQELRLGPGEIQAAIACYRVGKSASYDAAASVEHFRAVCALRHDLMRAFVELQLRAALAGNGMSLPARTILTRVAERLGISGLEFAHMEAALRARQNARGGYGGRPTAEKPLAACYAELEVSAGSSDQEVTKAYRRQMSRHHPDKLVANGLPESMAQVAKEKTQRIQEAYEAIRAARGMR
ncbi:MAG: co-chaperone DjlA [Steroidobacteraceae bacterium]|jgi:DnaJ like chaperone protein